MTPLLGSIERLVEARPHLELDSSGSGRLPRKARTRAPGRYAPRRPLMPEITPSFPEQML
jgi:hypothetical protein